VSTITTPEWVKDAIFYQIFPDRFAQSKAVPKPSNLEPWDSPPTTYGFKGGDLLGVVEHLDYLQDLGVTAIYFTPIFQSCANHRYHTHDYYQVDPILGGNAALRRLLDEAHRRDMRIVIDGVFNHASRGFFQFNHILENGPSSPYLDWFTVKGYPLHAYDSRPPNYVAWVGLKALPKLNTSTPAVRQFLWEVGRYWIEQGVDGWRLDVPAEIDDDEFWREFRRQVKGANPEAYIVAEIWHEAQRWLQGDQFDATMNYLFTMACLGWLARKTLALRLARHVWGYRSLRTLSGRAFAQTIDRLLTLYDPAVNQVQLNLLDSHDTARFLTLADGDESAFRLATLFQMTYPGAPCIYYGDEIGLMGGNDPDCRRTFPWDERRWNHSMRSYVKQCIALRRAHPALRRGDYTHLYVSGDVYAFGRRLADEAPSRPPFREVRRDGASNETIVVVLNASYATFELDVPLKGYLPAGSRLRDVWSNTPASVVGDRLRGGPIAPRGGAVLVWESEVKSP
jgi:neopullulanase